MVESLWSEAKVPRWSWGEPSIFGPTPSKPAKSTDWGLPSTRPKTPCFNSHSNPQSPVVSWSSASEISTNSTSIPPDIILKEIDNEFRQLQGEPIYTFGRQPTPGLETIRECIRKHTQALLDKIKSMEAEAEKEENRKALMKKKIREAILDGRNEALECRVKMIENLLVENLPLA